VPYLLERSALVRSLNVEPVPTSDSKQPQQSQWAVSLPFPRLPIRKLILSTSTRLFSRQVHVFEITTDGRGERSRRPLSGQVSWSSTPDRSEPSVAIELFAPPVTDRLYLETND